MVFNSFDNNSTIHSPLLVARAIWPPILLARFCGRSVMFAEAIEKGECNKKMAGDWN